jgi:tRNA(fMet)-specific endonuclease VapC
VHKAVDAFVNGLTIIPIFSSTKLYTKEKAKLSRIGKPLNDEFGLLIGVTAIQHKLVLVTDNLKDFKNLHGIKIENWFERKETKK